MKKFSCLFLACFLLVIFSGCAKEAPNTNYTVCVNCQGQVLPESNFCSNCGYDMTNRNANQEDAFLKDYSDFGFQNNYGLTEWMEISAYDFSDKNNAYVIVRANYMVVSFENGYLEERLFSTYYRGLSSKCIFEGNRNEGEFYNAEQYNVVSNYIIEKQITNFPTLELNVDIVSGIPIIETNEIHYPLLIPTEFIDWSRSFEESEYDPGYGYDVGYSQIKYYINADFLQ